MYLEILSEAKKLEFFDFLFWGVLKSLINLNLCKGPEVMSRLEENAEKPIFSVLMILGDLGSLSIGTSHTDPAAQHGRRSKISSSAPRIENCMCLGFIICAFATT